MSWCCMVVELQSLEKEEGEFYVYLFQQNPLCQQVPNLF
jgi:hypothetical protein